MYQSLAAFHVRDVRAWCWTIWKAALRRSRVRCDNARDRSASLQDTIWLQA